MGVWTDENRLIVHNGDLSGRVLAVNADEWKRKELLSVIDRGEEMLNVSFPDRFNDELVSNCHDSVFIVQEACRKALRDVGIKKTQSETKQLPKSLDALEYISEVVSDQSAQYEAFLRSFSDGFKDTEWEMYKWLLFVIITNKDEDLIEGVHYPNIRTQIKEYHPDGNDLNPGNLTQSLNHIASLQKDNNTKPIILDYDESDRRLSVVDRGFIIWMENTAEEYLLSFAGLEGVFKDE